MKNLNLLFCSLCVSLALFVACTDDDNGGGGGNGNYLSAVVKATEYGEWTYFDFATATSRTLKIKGEEGAVTGMYYGNLASTYIENTDSLQLIITHYTSDSVTIDLPEVIMGKMNSDEKDTISLSAHAKAQKENEKWILSGGVETCVVEKSDHSKTNYVVRFNGTIGTVKGADAELELFILPKGMYDMMGEQMNFGGTFRAKVDESYIYEVDGDEASFDWDLAFHKYDIRTNGGSAVKTDKTDLDEVTSVNIPATGFVEDTDGSVYADMSKMMKGFVGYQYVKVNQILYDWVSRTATGTMPPTIYTLNKNVFIVKTKDGKFGKIQFYDTTNEKGEAVYPSFNYEYPMK